MKVGIMFKHRRRNSVQILKMLLSFSSISLLFMFCNGGEFSESMSLSNFIRAVDPENRLRIDRIMLLSHPCSYKLKGIICDLRATAVVEIRLVNLSLNGILDVDHMCKLRNLRVLCLARNGIKGTIPNSILKCTSLRYLDLSRNSLSGNVPVVLTKLKNLRRLDISDNHFMTVVHNTTPKVIPVKEKPLDSRRFKDSFPQKKSETGYAMAPISLMPLHTRQDEEKSKMYKRWGMWILVCLGFTILLLLVVLFLYMRAVRGGKETETLKELAQSPSRSPPIEEMDEEKPEERRSELVLFVEKEEWFKLEDLLEAAADLHTQGLWSSLYKEPLISEYGYSEFLDPSLFKSNRYTAPEKTLSEKADVFSFGIILLELLTGKIVERSGLDLPRWVKSMVRDEWTGEVFDLEVSKVEMYAFPLLNVSMNCVVNRPEDRPSIAEVLVKIEEVVNAQQDCFSIPPATSNTFPTPGSTSSH
ncbi:probable leucine-rich repeat receptor-like protein kinase IMK3 [Olea europaea var. sylvestris]|uniref:probable leucine-rich repeat receptor-like protein kinase IMK3 n=1 Tax=Olea europaea var. sylvestris TaxID=158386 RepID=UPI000C1D7A61|nr:probable leucine-rich repeat receptor-like protein kinase IMK3 [Olea europaea var. sylvestris]